LPSKALKSELPLCPECEKLKEWWSFRWIKEPPPGVDSPDYGRHLQLERNLRSGAQFFCAVCKTRSFVEDRQKVIWTILDTALPLVDRWNQGTLRPTPEQWNSLQAIGSQPFVNYSTVEFRPRYFIPCRVTKHDGSVVDPARVVFQDHPPIDPWPEGQKFDFIDEVAKIEPSPYALSKELITAVENAPDITGHNTYLTYVEDRNDGHRFVLVGHPHFLKFENYRGSDLVLTNVRSDAPATAIEERFADITCFVADLLPEDDRLVT